MSSIVIEAFLRTAHAHPRRAAFVGPGGSFDYADAADSTTRIARAMVARGCAPGTPVAVLSPNHSRAFLCMLGALQADAAWVPVNMRNGVEANVDFLTTVGCRWLFWHGRLRADADLIRASVSSIDFAFQIDGDRGDIDSLAALIESASDATSSVEHAPIETIRTIVGTGGTTGQSKCVTWTDGNWRALLDTTTSIMPCTTPPVHLCVAPMTHAAGVLGMMLMPFGPTQIVMDQADPLEIMRAIERESVTHVYLPPTLLYLMLAHPQVRSFDYRSLRYFVVTAAPVAPHRLREAVDVFGPVMAQCYGQSEAPMICTFLSPSEVASAAANADDRLLSSCGRATALTEVAIMDDDGALMPLGDVGEIVVRGPLVMAGYLNDAAATAEVSHFGWHHTGDVGMLDAAGMVYINDRKKDLIITGGFNVYPTEVEHVLLSHPAVLECAVIGVPDDKWGEAVKGLVEIRRDAQVDAAELIALCRARLGAVKAPKTIEFRAALPRSAVGKVLKRTLRDEFWTGRPRAV